MENGTVKRYSLSKQVSDQLEKMIESGHYKIGDQIPTEIELMELFSVSRNTIREAVQSLTSAGILEVKQGDGTYVRSNNRFDANMSMKLENVGFEEINEARKSLEIAVCNYAAERRTKKELEAIKKALDNRQSQTSSEKEHTIADLQFHMEIAKACHNVILLDLYKSLYSFLLNHIEQRSKKTNLSHLEIDKLHEDLYEAIKDQDDYKAALTARKILEI